MSEMIEPCTECDGNGWVEDPEDGGSMTCPECNGMNFFRCRDCGVGCETEDSDPECQVVCDTCVLAYCNLCFLAGKREPGSPHCKSCAAELAEREKMPEPFNDSEIPF